MSKDKKIAVVGVGGVGGYFGGLLAKSGFNVTFFARGSNFKALKENGLVIESVNGNFEINPVQVSNNTSEIGQVELILLCVKSYQVEEVMSSIKPLVGEKTAILPIQNGIDAPNQLAKYFDEKNVLSGSCKIMSHQTSPGKIKHDGAGVIEFGEFKGPITSRVLEIKEILESAGIKAIPYDDVRIPLWSKMIFACPLSGLNSITRSTIGEIRSIPETRELLFKAMGEILNVAHKLGIGLKDNLPELLLGGIDGLKHNFTTSMALDIKHGKPSELHYQVGAISRIGMELGIETPINTFIYYSLLPLEIKARKK